METNNSIEITKSGYAVLKRDTHISKWVIEHKRLDFDQNVLPIYLPYFKKGGTLINIGANIGCYAYAFVDLAKEIHCFEPNEEAFECLKYNLSKYENVNLYNIGISDKIERVNVNNDCDNVGMAFLESDKNGNMFTTDLDSYKLDSCDFILMDCEGFELKALNGATKTIDKYQPVLVIEINDMTLERVGIKRQDIFDFLDNKGYIYNNIYQNHSLHEYQMDIICLPKD